MNRKQLVIGILGGLAIVATLLIVQFSLFGC